MAQTAAGIPTNRRCRINSHIQSKFGEPRMTRTSNSLSKGSFRSDSDPYQLSDRAFAMKS